MKITKLLKLKNILRGGIIIVAAVLIYVGIGALHSPHAALKTKDTSSASIKAPSVQTASSQSPLSILPKPPLNCSTNASLVDATVDYVITNMGCSGSSSQGTVLLCNGTIFQHASNVNMQCYRPDYYSYNDLLLCSGTANSASAPKNLSFNYNCSTPNDSSYTVYSCNGTINNFSSLAVSLPTNVSCGG